MKWPAVPRLHVPASATAALPLPCPASLPFSLPVLVPVPVSVPVTCGHRRVELTVCSAHPSTPERYACSPLGAGSQSRGRCPVHRGLGPLPGPGPTSAASRRLAWPWSGRRPQGAHSRFRLSRFPGSCGLRLKEEAICQPSAAWPTLARLNVLPT